MACNFELPPGFSADVVHTSSAQQLRDQRDAQIDLTVFISCYNEQEFIVKTIERTCTALAYVAPFSYEIIVIDDCSSDKSPQLLHAFVHDHQDIPIILRCNRKNRGLSQNYVDAAFFGIGKYYRLVCGDAAESTQAMIEVFSAIGSADIIIPYYPSTIPGKGIGRRVISNAYVRLINALTRQNIKYYNGLPVHRRFHVMRWHPTTRGFGFQADILCMLLELGYSYTEIPVNVVEHKGSKSTALTLSNFLSVVHTAINIIIRRCSRRIYEGNRPRRQHSP